MGLLIRVPGCPIRPVPRSPRNTSSINALIRGVVVLLAPALASAAGAGDLQEDAARLERLSAALFDLEAADFEARAASLRAEDEDALIEAMVLRAGRAVPPGVGVARAALREARAEESSTGCAPARPVTPASSPRSREPRRGGRSAGAASSWAPPSRPRRGWTSSSSAPLARVLDVDDAGLRAAAGLFAASPAGTRSSRPSPARASWDAA